MSNGAPLNGASRSAFARPVSRPEAARIPAVRRPASPVTSSAANGNNSSREEDIEIDVDDDDEDADVDDDEEDVDDEDAAAADADVEADYIVVEIARHVLGADWMPQYVKRANEGGIERVLV